MLKPFTAALPFSDIYQHLRFLVSEPVEHLEYYGKCKAIFAS